MHAVPKMGLPDGPILGPCLGSFFEVFCIKVAEAQRFGFNEALWIHEQVYSEFFGKAVHHTKLGQEYPYRLCAALG